MSEPGDVVPPPAPDPRPARPSGADGSEAPRRRGAASSRPTPDRRNVIVAACAGLVVVVVCLVLTRGGDGGGAGGENPGAVAPSAPQQVAENPQDPLVDAVTVDEPVPAGDYTKLCTTLAKYAATSSKTPSFEDAVAFYRRLEFAPLMEVAPAGLRPTLEVLERDRADVVTTLDQVPSLADLSVEDLPADWLQAFGMAFKVIYTECPRVLAPSGGG